MPFLAGENITAGRLNRLQPKTLYANATGTVPVSSSNVTVPGCTVAFTTETNGATVKIEWFAAFYQSGASAPTANGNVRPIIDGTGGSPVFALADIRTVGEKIVASASWTTTVAVAGAHSVLLQATTPAGLTVSTYTGISVTIFEVV